MNATEFGVIVMLIVWIIYEIDELFVRHKFLLVQLTLDSMIDFT